jgi:hypothetical protein
MTQNTKILARSDKPGLQAHATNSGPAIMPGYRKEPTMRKLMLALAVLAGTATSFVSAAHADCRWEWNGNGWQQICR